MPTSLKGSIKTAPMNLKTAAIVKPTIRKGNKKSQTSGNKNSKTMAIGQHMTSRIPQRTITAKSLIVNFCVFIAKFRPIPEACNLSCAASRVPAHYTLMYTLVSTRAHLLAIIF